MRNFWYRKPLKPGDCCSSQCYVFSLVDISGDLNLLEFLSATSFADMTNTAFILLTCLQPRERNDRCELTSHLTEAYLIGFLMVFRLVQSHCKGLLAREIVKILMDSSLLLPTSHLDHENEFLVGIPFSTR